jgi:hypothetical protein
MITLTRQYKRADGIFSRLTNDDQFLGWTLEHAFEQLTADGTVVEPIIPEGEWTCVRGWHQLEHGPRFETFEVTGIEGHSGLLFHWGNWNKDSDGCILVGHDIDKSVSPWMVTNSRDAFAEFMQMLDMAVQFQLTVQ